MTEASFVQPLKVRGLISVIPEGISTAVKAVQYMKAPLPVLFKAVGLAAVEENSTVARA